VAFQPLSVRSVSRIFKEFYMYFERGEGWKYVHLHLVLQLNSFLRFCLPFTLHRELSVFTLNDKYYIKFRLRYS
jgi:hypothetical protein